MKSMTSRIRTALRVGFPKMSSYAGTDGQVWFVGASGRSPSIAEFFCGSDMRAGRQMRIRRGQAAARSIQRAVGGAVSILYPRPDEPRLPHSDDRAVEVPLRIVLRKALPDTTEALMAGLKTSTTKEDLRRIRKAGFTFRVTKDPGDIRTFHAGHYVPLVNQRFPDDGSIMSLEKMLGNLERGGETVCADLDGEWVAGLFNWAHADNYAMGPLGIRDADEAVRQKRVVSGLLVASMERAVELGRPTATLGFSLPFLGKGPIWFKAKWGCTLEIEPRSPAMQIFMDLRHAPVRRTLAASPLIQHEAGDLAVSAWLPPGDASLNALVREAGRFPGLSRWYVLAEPETLAAAGDALAANDRIVPIGVDPRAAEPLWLGQLLPGRG